MGMARRRGPSIPIPELQNHKAPSVLSLEQSQVRTLGTFTVNRECKKRMKGASLLSALCPQSSSGMPVTQWYRRKPVKG